MARHPSNRGKNLKRGKPRKTNIARTALGTEPEKRSLSKKPTSAADQAAKRELTEKVKTARGRKLSSTLWLQRQLNDPYVVRARAEGYRSRAAYKLIELNEKFDFLKTGGRIVDLGAAPGGWCQVAMRETKGKGIVIGIDYLEMGLVEGATILQLDFLEPDAPAKLKEALNGQADVVMSDMAAPTTGHKATDHMRIISLAESALDFAEEVLAPGGVFLAKVLQGGSEKSFLDRLKARFKKVAHAKPDASRADSAEMYVVAVGFRDLKNEIDSDNVE